MAKVLQIAYFIIVFGVFTNAAPALSSTPLISAVKQNQYEVVKALIEQNVLINKADVDGSTALQWAVYTENSDVVSLLVEAGADVEDANREGITPLIMASTTGNSRIVELLLNAGADVSRTLPGGETPLMMAARTGDLETIQIILNRGADIDAIEQHRGTTALMWAAAYKNSAVVRLLLENGADYSLNSATTAPGRGAYLAPTARERIRDFYNGIGLVAEFSGEDELEGEEGLQVEITRDELLRRIPEDLVAQFEKELAQEKSQAPARQQWGGLTALHFAVRENDLASVMALIDGGADINQLSEFGWSPLLTATQNRFYKLGAYLLLQGANPNLANGGGWNPLYIATDNRNIEAGDYPTRKPDMAHLEFITLLLEAGANPNLRMQSSTETRTIFTHQWLQEEGATPFLRAAQSSDIVLLKLLLEYGANPNINTNYGVTPLMLASGIAWVEGVTYEWSEADNQETIKLLLSLGNNPNAQDTEDLRTAMMGAAHKGRNYAIELLVAAGGDLSIRDIGSRDSLYQLTGVTWQAIDYAAGLVRVGVQSAEVHPDTEALIRRMMIARNLAVPPAGRTLDSICVVEICK